MEGDHCYQLHTKLYPIFLPQGVTSYVGEIMWDHQCGFRSNRSTNDQIFWINQI